MNGGAQIPLWLLAALCPVFAAVAAAYSAVGLGGGTGYIAIMVLAGLPAQNIPSTALLLNIGVTGTSLIRYGLAGRLRACILVPFLVPAIPAAFVGGLCRTPHRVFFVVLAVALLVAAAATLRSARQTDKELRQPRLSTRWAVGIPCGAAIGFVSGLVGIGGGVFTGPLLLSLRWAGAKEVAAMNALLVFVLSAVGLIGHGMNGSVSISLVGPFAVATLAGGLLGAHVSERRLSQATLQKIFSVIILVAGLKAVIDALR
jgi:uncharacterized membrane protein YfcA